MGDSTVAIVWGVPVKIIDLLFNLDAFVAAHQTISTLRLCNRLGKGDSVHVTKLPKELLELVENELMVYFRKEERHSFDKWPRWNQKYCCFEGPCRPSYHLNESSGMQLREDAQHEICEENPQYHLDAMYEQGGPFPEEFENLVGQRADELCWDFEGFKEKIDRNKEHWSLLMTQGEKVRFMEYDELLRKHFGLEALIMHEVLDRSTARYVCRTDKRFPKDRPPKKATICYLALPHQSATCEIRQDYEPDYYTDYTPPVLSGKSILVAPESLQFTEAHRKRFGKAMRFLGLQPSVHPTQLLGSPISAFCVDQGYTNLKAKMKPAASHPSKLSDDQKAEIDATITERIQSLEKSQWPKLMILVKESLSFD